MICMDENGYMWFENECFCVDFEYECCCGLGKIYCIESRLCI